MEEKVADSLKSESLPFVGWREIDEREFVQDTPFFSYGSLETGWMQFPVDLKGAKPRAYVDIRYFIYQGGAGVALVDDNWAGKVHYFRFGCGHEYKELSVQEAQNRGLTHFGNCWHVYVCEKCGHVRSTDSSG